MSAATVSETQQRFLRDVVERVPLDRIVELHLFAPIKQGGTETGVAVLAALQPVVENEPATGETDAIEQDVPEEPATGEAEAIEPDVTEEPGETVEVPLADSTRELELELADVEIPAPQTRDQLPLVRHVVLTARYRFTLKGPDRGRWEMDIREEADATLVTVDAVVRGVQKRVGDLADVERLSPSQLAIAVSDTPWRATESED